MVCWGSPILRNNQTTQEQTAWPIPWTHHSSQAYCLTRSQRFQLWVEHSWTNHFCLKVLLKWYVLLTFPTKTLHFALLFPWNLADSSVQPISNWLRFTPRHHRAPGSVPCNGGAFTSATRKAPSTGTVVPWRSRTKSCMASADMRQTMRGRRWVWGGLKIDYFVIINWGKYYY